MNIKKTFQVVQEIKDTILNRALNAPALSTHFKAIDDVLGGFNPGELIIVSGRNGVGTTALTLNMASTIADENYPILLFSLEHSASDVVSKLLTQVGITRISGMNHLQDLLMEDLEKISKMKDVPLYIDDTPNQSIDEIEDTIRNSVSIYGVKVAFIDYLQLVSHSEDNLSRPILAFEKFKNLAQELSITIVCLSRKEKWPLVNKSNYRADLTDISRLGSGITYELLDKYVDSALVLSRPDMHGLGKENNKAELYVIHNKHGRRNIMVELQYLPDKYTFTEIEEKIN